METVSLLHCLRLASKEETHFPRQITFTNKIKIHLSTDVPLLNSMHTLKTWCRGGETPHIFKPSIRWCHTLKILDLFYTTEKLNRVCVCKEDYIQALHSATRGQQTVKLMSAIQVTWKDSLERLHTIWSGAWMNKSLVTGCHGD
jgi:hypothetical protein